MLSRRMKSDDISCAQVSRGHENKRLSNQYRLLMSLIFRSPSSVQRCSSAVGLLPLCSPSESSGFPYGNVMATHSD